MTIQRRNFTGLLAASVAAPAVVLAADRYPSRAVRVISPFPPGGSADATARVLCERLSTRLGQAFYIENRSGAAGAIGSDVTARSAPDGYTLIIGAAGAMALNKSLYKNLPYDPVRDFSPISMVGYTPVLLAANPSGTADTVGELIAAAKAAPGKISFASIGNGTMHHLVAEMFMREAGIQMVHVPYGGAAVSAQDVIAGHVPYGFLDMTRCLSLMEAGKLKGIATSGLKRSLATPKLPTISESGLPGFDAVGWFGLFGPRNMQAATVDLLNAHIKEVLTEPAFQSTALRLAVETRSSTPQELRDFQIKEVDKWAEVVRVAKISIE